MTLQDLIHSLRQLDEVTVVEVLDLHTDEIIARCMDIIETRFEELQYKVEDPREYDEDRRQPLTGQLTWKSTHEESSDWQDSDE